MHIATHMGTGIYGTGFIISKLHGACERWVRDASKQFGNCGSNVSVKGFGGASEFQ